MNSNRPRPDECSSSSTPPKNIASESYSGPVDAENNVVRTPVNSPYEDTFQRYTCHSLNSNQRKDNTYSNRPKLCSVEPMDMINPYSINSSPNNIFYWPQVHDGRCRPVKELLSDPSISQEHKDELKATHPWLEAFTKKEIDYERRKADKKTSTENMRDSMWASSNVLSEGLKKALTNRSSFRGQPSHQEDIFGQAASVKVQNLSGVDVRTQQQSCRKIVNMNDADNNEGKEKAYNTTNTIDLFEKNQYGNPTEYAEDEGQSYFGSVPSPSKQKQLRVEWQKMAAAGWQRFLDKETSEEREQRIRDEIRKRDSEKPGNFMLRENDAGFGLQPGEVPGENSVRYGMEGVSGPFRILQHAMQDPRVSQEKKDELCAEYSFLNKYR